MDKFNSKLEMTEKRAAHLKDRSTEVIQVKEQKKKKRLKKNERNLQNFQDNIERSEEITQAAEDRKT